MYIITTKQWSHSSLNFTEKQGKGTFWNEKLYITNLAYPAGVGAGTEVLSYGLYTVGYTATKGVVSYIHHKLGLSSKRGRGRRGGYKL